MVKSFTKHIVVAGGSLALLSLIVSSDAKVSSFNHAATVEANQALIVADTPKTKNAEAPVKLPYKFEDQSTGDPLNYPNSGGLMLNNPANINTDVQYNPSTGNYDINQTMGSLNYRPPTYMESEEYQNYMFNQQVKDYWSARSHADSKNKLNKPIVPKLKVGGAVFDRIFGGNNVEIIPNGSAELIFGYKGINTQNPIIPQKNRKINTFDFNERIQLNVVGKIGDKLKITSSYNTESTFDFENQMKLDYTGYQDEIIKKIEAGNITMPLNTTLIQGSQTLFGIKTVLQFGRLTLTSVLSQEKGAQSTIMVNGGVQSTSFSIAGDNYDANRHFFLAQYFRDQYDNALAGLPFVNSEVNINRIEVWVSNTNTSTTNIRSVVAFSELAEDETHIPLDQQRFIKDISSSVLPFSNQNSLYKEMNANPAVRVINTTVSTITALSGDAMQQQTDYELISSARMLLPSEYTVNAKLGYIDLKQQVNPAQALSVAYQYTLNGQTYQVGEFSTDGITAPEALITKMLKSTATNVTRPMWNLMMKNIYALGGFQISPQNFMLNIFYTNLQTGTDINYLPVSECQNEIHERTLLEVLNCDRLNSQNDKSPDGLYDFFDGYTVNASNGLVIFPVVDPFGSFLNSRFNTSCSATEATSYVFNQLYDSTKIVAQQYFPQLDRFKLKGSYQSSSSSEISLGAPNVPKGSVTVMAGGVLLTENIDYTVDYTLGRVKIINDAILSSGTPITVHSGSNALFAVQQKSLYGSHAEYIINKDFTVGATLMHLTQRPINNKVNLGSEPVSNTVIGVNANQKTAAPFLTKLVDKIPFIKTDAASNINSGGEFAYLIPGENKAVSNTAYVDDFEGTQSTIDLRTQSAWSLASTPQLQPTLFPEGNFTDSLAYGFNRAKLSWYTISPEFLIQTPGITPSNINNTIMSNNFEREVLETEVFPNEQLPNGVPAYISTFDMAYYPSIVGPYNYDAKGLLGISAGLDANGNLKSPQTRWAGVERAMQTTDFQSTNIQYIQFWVMDPFNSDNHNPNTTGDLYFNLGSVSEDILRDGNKFEENAMPTPITPEQTQLSIWGQVPVVQPLIYVFNNTDSERPYQDIGLDGLADALSLGGTEPTEQTFFSKYLNDVKSVAPNAYASISADPSHDDFHYFRGTDYDNANNGAGLTTLERYVQFTGTETNSRAASQSPESYPTSAKLTPDVEDINLDNNLSTVESYYQYHISLKPGDFASGVGTNYITTVLNTTGQNMKNDSTKAIKWYQFKIPITLPEANIGNMEGFQSIRFMRMFFKNVDQPIILRFARLELLRLDWREYEFSLLQPGLYIPTDNAGTTFDVSAVNLQENGTKSPVNYVLPPGITRQISPGSANLVALNEQSLALTVCNLQDGDARAAFKNITLDVRSYKELQMFIHAEQGANAAEVLRNNDLYAFIRIGTDFTENYYEYDIPLQVSAPGSYNGGTDAGQLAVWPAANNMVLDFDKLTAAKLARNNTSGSSVTVPYTVPDGNNKISVVGNPNLGAVVVIMLGILNPKKQGNDPSDDGKPKCAQVWYDELRLTGLNTKGGWAAVAHSTAQLADFGTISLSGNMSTPGWGSLDSKISQLSKQTTEQYNLTSTFELGKFLPKNSNVKIPLYIGTSTTLILPEYDPYNPDLLISQELPTLSSANRKALKQNTEDFTGQKSFNFTNVKKLRAKDSKKKMRFYDIENWSASYSYTALAKHNSTIQYNNTITQKGALVYSFAPTPKSITPFAKTKIFQSKYLQLIKDFNFSPVPAQLGFASNLLRTYNTSEYRDITGGDMIILPTYVENFTWKRNYNLSYALTKALKVDFIATNNATILEPIGPITTKSQRDTIRNNLLDLGKTTQYTHQATVTYAIPINKLPFLDFTKASVKYTGTYTWTRAPFGADSLGNTIQNSGNIQWTGELNMTTLYNKVPFLKKINQLKPGGNNNNKNNNASPPLKGKNTKAVSDSIKKSKKEIGKGMEYFGRIIMSVKSVSATYSTNDGTILPGYSQFTDILGMNGSFEGPTPGFILGSQKDIREEAIQKNWLVKTPSINTPYVTTSTKNLNLRSDIEPIPGLKIELSAVQTTSRNTSEYFKWNDSSESYVHYSPTETGNYSTSFISYRTSFENGAEVFQKFLNAEPTISARLGAENPNSVGSSGGYAQGYNATSQDVLIPAFLAAYGGQNSSKVSLSPFPAIPMPNWQMKYDGLSKIDFFKKYFKTITLSNSYRSTYNVTGYTSNLLYETDANNNATSKEIIASVPNNPNFYSKNIISSATIAEQWNPLMRVDVTLHNSMLVNLQFNRNRNLSLGTTSLSITEVDGNEIIIGSGYKFKDVKLPKNFKVQGKPIKSDLTLTCDLSFRKNETTYRSITQDYSQPTGGTDIISLKTAATYMITTRFNVRLFYDRIINKPVMSNAFQTTNTNAGLSLRLSLSN